VEVRRRLRGNRLSIDFDGAALVRNANGRRVATAFKAIVTVVHSVLRRGEGAPRLSRRAPYELESEPEQTDVDPLSRNLWHGVPREPPRAIVLGPPYAGHWPELERLARAEGRALIACPPILTTGADALVRLARKRMVANLAERARSWFSRSEG
jgi:hypothetical protein